MAKAVKKAATKKEEEKESIVNFNPAGTHEASQEFSDYAESLDGTDYKRYKVGEDVSHLPESKLRTLVEAGLVKKTEKKAEE
jgi:hypothetical protein